MAVGMVTDNISLAVQIEAEHVKPARMLAPVVQMERGMFVASYKQITQKAALNVGEIADIDVVEEIFGRFPDLMQNNDSRQIRSNAIEA